MRQKPTQALSCFLSALRLLLMFVNSPTDIYFAAVLLLNCAYSFELLCDVPSANKFVTKAVSLLERLDASIQESKEDKDLEALALDSAACILE